MEKKLTISKIGKKEENPLNKAIRYYSIISAVGNLNLTEKEIKLLAFAAIKGNISSFSNKEEFCKLYNSSSAYINNMISRLKKNSLLIKDTGKIKVNPQILLDFNNNILLQLTISDG